MKRRVFDGLDLLIKEASGWVCSGKMISFLDATAKATEKLKIELLFIGVIGQVGHEFCCIDGLAAVIAAELLMMWQT